MVVEAVMETSLPTSTTIFWLVIISLNLAVKTEMKLILCIICGTKNTIPAGFGTHWHRNFVTHREMDRWRSGPFTPQDVVTQRIQQAKDCVRDIGVGKDKCMTRRMGSRTGCTILVLFVNCVFLLYPIHTTVGIHVNLRKSGACLSLQ